MSDMAHIIWDSKNIPSQSDLWSARGRWRSVYAHVSNRPPMDFNRYITMPFITPLSFRYKSGFVKIK